MQSLEDIVLAALAVVAIIGLIGMKYQKKR